MTLYSQRDPRWSNIFLGDNKSQPYTLGNFGCLITCFSSYIDKSPDQTNSLLKENKAFVNGGLFVWSKSSVLGLNQTYVSPSYTGLVTDQGVAKMKDIIDQGYPLVCEVDFNPNTQGEEMHFVLLLRYEGDSFYAMDPWTGEIVNLSLYGGIKRAVIQFRSYDKKISVNPPTGSSTPPSLIMNDQTIIDLGRFGKMEIQAIRGKLGDLELAQAKIIDLENIPTIANSSAWVLISEGLKKLKP